MRRIVKKSLALLLALVMCGNLLPISAAASGADEADAVRKAAGSSPAGIELEMEDLNPRGLNVRRLGEIDEEQEGPDELKLPFALSDVLRVSIFLDDPATLDAGYSARGVGTNAAANAYRQTLRAQQAAVTTEIERTIGHKLNVQWNLTLAVNAISAYMTYGDMIRIGSLKSIRSVEIENRYEPQADQINTSNTSFGMVGAQTAWDSGRGYTGAGSRIAIIDTGVDYEHQSFNADAFNHAIEEVRSFGKTVNLMTQGDWSGLTLNASGARYVSTKIPFGFNYVDKTGTLTSLGHMDDTEGEHGSHVAGIAAANRYIKSGGSFSDAAETVKAVGMAPDAQILIMKVFGANGGAYDSDYMAAIEDAITLDCDAANLSLGSSTPGYTYANSYQTVMNSLSGDTNEGLVVTISAGNAGALTDNLSTDLYIDDVYMHTGGSPGTFINSLCVAAAQNIGNTGTPLVFNGSQTVFYAETENTGGSMSAIAGSYSYVYIDAVGEAADYTTVNSAENLNGKIVIVNRGSNNFIEKGNNAVSVEPKGLIVANNQPGSINMSLDGYTGTFPMVSITLKDAETIKENSTKKTTGDYTYYTGSVTVTDVTESGVNMTRDDAEVTEFSSWGVPGSLLMKPEITAPGGDIYSVFGSSQTASGGTAGGSDKYELMSGTSMAAPHMAGLAAIVAQYLRENDFSANTALASLSTRQIIQSLLMSTATPMKPDGVYQSILQQGAGLAEVSKATTASSVIMMNDAGLTSSTGAAADGKIKFEFGDDPEKAGTYAYSFTLYNLTNKNLAFKLNTELFTQANDGTFMLPQTSNLPAGGVSYAWSGEAVTESHDVDKDGDTDNDDAQAILDYLTGELAQTSVDLAAADMDGDGAVTSHDAQLLIDWSAETVSGYVLPANGTASVSVTISLTDAQRAALAAFPSGAYLQGFTYVTCTTSDNEGVSYEHEHTIPILGFYGSWTDPSMFDNTSYIDTLYGTAKTPYSGSTNTNYMSWTVGGITTKFTGNPYMVESSFPADRLAVNSNSNFANIYYNLIRSAGSTGFAVSKVDGYGGSVTDVVSSSVVGSNVDGLWYYAAQGKWQNTGTKFYSVNKSPASYGFAEGDMFRIGFYAIPEYNAMMLSGDMTSAGSGTLSASSFKSILTENMIGRGAYIGYDFVVDDTNPIIETPTLNGSNLTVSASDDRNLAYVAVLSLDGEIKYSEAAPGQSTYSITFDASDAIANAHGYVAVFAADYAGNEVAKAVKVNNNTFEEKTIYVLTNTLSAGNDYLIVSRNSVGAGYALGHSGSTVATNRVTVNSGIDATNGQPYIESGDAASTSVWTVSGSYTFKNGNYYLSRSLLSNALQVSTSTSNNVWTWNGSNNRLSNGSRYLRFSNNTFSLNTTAANVYMYVKTVIRTEIDPYGASSITLTPASLDLYKGNTADIVAKVLPLTVEDRTVVWTSSNPGVATVDENGHVTAVAAGTTAITAAARSNPAVFETCNVSVTAVNKNLNGIVWDEEGGVYFSSFHASSLPNWTKLHDDTKGMELHSAFMQSASELYAGTLDTSSAQTILYSVDRNGYALSEYGTNFVFATDLAPASTRYTGYFVFSYAKYLVFGNLAPEDRDGEMYSGLPYGLLDASEKIGDGVFIAAVAAKSVGRTSSSYYFLDENGKIWQTTMTIGNDVSFGTPSLVLDTGIRTSFLYQTLYYDGTYLYWGHTTDNTAELIVINPSTGALYHAGDFGDGVWPAVGFYVDGSVAPASAGNEPMGVLEGLQPLLSRDELMSEDVLARFSAEAMKFASTPAPDVLSAEETNEAGKTDAEEAEPVAAAADEAANPTSGALNAYNGLRNAFAKRPTAEPNAVFIPGSTDSNGSVTVTLSEAERSANGLITVTYDPSEMTYVSETSSLEFISVHDDGAGQIKAAYASKSELDANSPIAVLSFTVSSCTDVSITAKTIERNTAYDLNEETENPPEIGGTGHAWELIGFTWTGDEESGYTAAEALFRCANNADHTETVEAEITTETVDAACEEAGTVTYTATVTFSGETYTDAKTVETEALGHEWGEPAWTWAEDFSHATAAFICARCDESLDLESDVVRTYDKATFTETFTATVELEGQAYTDSKDRVLVIPVEYADIAPYRGETYSAPTKDGYVFAGWYTDESFTTPIGKEVKSGAACAKFVDARVLTAKWQVSAKITPDSESTKLRLLTSVDTLDYIEVGFDVVFGGTKKLDITTKEVYRQVTGYQKGKTEYYTPDVFSPISAYFMTATVTGIKNAHFNTTFEVTPKWLTLDGTVVIGTTKTFKISDDPAFLK